MPEPEQIVLEDVAGYSIEEILESADMGVAEGYLLASWFYRAMEAIKDARLRNGLTQSDVAEKIGTTQSVIARMENAHRGNFSVARFLDYAWACGAAPLELEFVSPETLRRFAIEQPGQAKGAETLDAWRPSEKRNQRQERSEHLG